MYERMLTVSGEATFLSYSVKFWSKQFGLGSQLKTTGNLKECGEKSVLFWQIKRLKIYRIFKEIGILAGTA